VLFASSGQQEVPGTSPELARGPTQAKPPRIGTVGEVRTAIKNGDRFYTVSASKGTKAYIEPWDIPTLRTKPDHLKDDNLDNLRACAFPK